MYFHVIYILLLTRNHQHAIYAFPSVLGQFNVIIIKTPTPPSRQYASACIPRPCHLRNTRNGSLSGVVYLLVSVSHCAVDCKICHAMFVLIAQACRLFEVVFTLTLERQPRHDGHRSHTSKSSIALVSGTVSVRGATTPDPRPCRGISTWKLSCHCSSGFSLAARPPRTEAESLAPHIRGPSSSRRSLRSTFPKRRFVSLLSQYC